MISKFLLLAGFALLSWGQTVEVGARAGIPLTNAFNSSSFFTIGFGESLTSAPRRYTVGPMVRVSLPHGFGVESDALYKRLGFDDFQKEAELIFTYTRGIANSWEFPVLGTYRFLHRLPVKPYVSGGPAFRITRVSSLSAYQIIDECCYPVSVLHPAGSPVLDNRSGHGVTAGLGAELHAGFLRISPEVRYTRWAADANNTAYSNQNQLDLLVGFGVRCR